MVSRAIVIAIEEYPHSQGELAQTLPTTIESAEKFRDWLINTKAVKPADILFCASPRCPGSTSGATRADLVDAIAQLVADGKDKTEELFLFFSGHGFSYQDSIRNPPLDVLVASDFETLEGSGDICVRLDEIQTKLSNAMGPGDHYYFIDACRSNVKASEIDVTGMGRTFSPSKLGRPSVYTLFSTERGVAAVASSSFVSNLLNGLSGREKAKIWVRGVQDKMFVTFESLFDYLSLKGQEVDRLVQGRGAGTILVLDPIPTFACDVRIENANEQDSFTLIVKARGRQIGEPKTFSGDRHTFRDVPDDYEVEVLHPLGTVEQMEPPPPALADLYSDAVITYRKARRVRGPIRTPVPSTVRLDAFGPADTEIRVRNLSNGDVQSAQGHFAGDVQPGEYSIELIEDGWTTVRQETVSIPPGSAPVQVSREWFVRTPVQGAILSALPSYAVKDGRVEFSESIGPTAIADLAVWLSIAGASRILHNEDPQGPQLRFSKLGHLPLQTFEDAQPGTAFVYVLAGLEGAPAGIHVGLSREAKPDPDWEYVPQVPGLAGIYERRFEVAPGAHLVSVKLPGKATITLPTFAFSNRCSFAALTEAADDTIAINHYALPVGKLFGSLDPMVRARLGNRPLNSVKYFALAQQRFAANRDIAPPANSGHYNDWLELLYGKWLDPVTALIAAFELLRRNATEREADFPTVVANLRQFFGLPDVESLARLGGMPHQVPGSVPLLIDGLLAFEDYEIRLPLPAKTLKYRGPWTAWRAAVAPPAT